MLLFLLRWHVLACQRPFYDTFVDALTWLLGRRYGVKSSCYFGIFSHVRHPHLLFPVLSAT